MTYRTLQNDNYLKSYMNLICELVHCLLLFGICALCATGYGMGTVRLYAVLRSGRVALGAGDRIPEADKLVFGGDRIC
jgi:hypothetical protein